MNLLTLSQFKKEVVQFTLLFYFLKKKAIGPFSGLSAAVNQK